MPPCAAVNFLEVPMTSLLTLLPPRLSSKVTPMPPKTPKPQSMPFVVMAVLKWPRTGKVCRMIDATFVDSISRKGGLDSKLY
uniref:Secreted protein n=1 Tax=Panagrellus redivivus TaxID=6233 RepID=A0A7E4W5C2_PANRE